MPVRLRPVLLNPLHVLSIADPVLPQSERPRSEVAGEEEDQDGGGVGAGAQTFLRGGLDTEAVLDRADGHAIEAAYAFGAQDVDLLRDGQARHADLVAETAVDAGLRIALDARG